MADMLFLGTHTIQRVVSFRGDPSKHLERCCCPLIKVLQNSIFEQVIRDVFNKEMFSFPFALFVLFGSPHLLEGIETFPESRTDLTQQLHQRVAKEFGSCWFGVEVEGSRSKTITGVYNKVFVQDSFECQKKKVGGCI